jgi:hypothetical protein
MMIRVLGMTNNARYVNNSSMLLRKKATLMLQCSNLEVRRMAYRKLAFLKG